MGSLVDIVRDRIPDAAWSGDLETELAVAVDRLRAARPDVAIEPAVFVRYLADRVEDDDVSLWLAQAQLDDLFLACGCALGDSAALAAFERDLTAELRAAVGRLGLSAADVADTLADLREKLLVRGRIADYAGRGALRTWLRVIAIRAGISVARRQRHDISEPAELADLVAPLGDPEAAVIAAQFRQELRAAFAGAVATLEVRERNLLRQHLLDGLTIDDLGALYHVHRVTASRWVARAREQVWAATVLALRAQLKVTAAQLDSLLAAVRTGLDLSLERVLAA